MKNLQTCNVIFCIIFAVLSVSVYSQDLIVTNEGDSINCKITKIKEEMIYFTFKHKDEIRSTLIPISQVKFHQYNYYQFAVVPAEKILSKEDYPHFRAAINGGWSYMIARLSDEIPPSLRQYSKELKSGYHYEMDLSYYFSEHVGFGLKYTGFQTKNELDNVIVTLLDGTTQYGKMGDNISVNFIGPVVGIRLLNKNKKNCLVLSLGMGYLGYKDKSVLIYDYIFTGSTLGSCWDIGYDIEIKDKLAIGFQLSYMSGILTQYEISDGIHTETIKLDKDNYESLARIDLSIGLRFNK